MNRLGIAVLAAWIVFGGANAWRGASAAPQPPGGTINADISGCASCHADPNDKGMERFRKNFQSHEHVLLNESDTWLKHDPHSKAFAVLDPKNSKYAARMQERLRDRYGDLTKAPACLTCHAIDTKPTKPFAQKVVGDFVCDADAGVNCNACHGLGEPWQGEHYRPENWRSKTPVEKLDRGMINLRDPVVKAELCASCHVGSPSLGRVVTHEMYAAGHPPLMPLELVTYMHDQPQHWGTPFDERLKFFHGLSAEDARRFYSYFKDEGLEGYTARDVAIGALVGLKAEADLLAADAASREAHQGLDFARFDCYACHHDLKLPSDRQNRDGPPGRPPLKAWNGALAGAIARHAEGLSDPAAAELAKAFDSKWQAARNAAWSRPYGDPRAMASAAAELSEWCSQMIASLQARSLYSPDEARRLSEVVREAALNPAILPDGEAVMALVWAGRSLDRVLAKPGADWSKLAAKIPVQLRSKTINESERPVTVGELLTERMKLFNDYDAQSFATAFRDLFPDAR